MVSCENFNLSSKQLRLFITNINFVFDKLFNNLSPESQSSNKRVNYLCTSRKRRWWRDIKVPLTWNAIWINSRCTCLRRIRFNVTSESVTQICLDLFRLVWCWATTSLASESCVRKNYDSVFLLRSSKRFSHGFWFCLMLIDSSPILLITLLFMQIFDG